MIIAFKMDIQTHKQDKNIISFQPHYVQWTIKKLPNNIHIFTVKITRNKLTV